MAAKPRGKPPKSSFGDDLLDSLFDDTKPPVRGRAARSGPLVRSTATDNIFSMLAEEVKRDGEESEESDVSAADPNDILKNMKDMDDMDAELFAPKKNTVSAPAQTHDKKGTKKTPSTSKTNVKTEETDKPTPEEKTPNSAPPLTTSQNYKKFTFSDEEDPLADLLDDLLPEETKPKSKPSTQQSKPVKSTPSAAASPILETDPPKAAKKHADITFDDKEDLIDALGFDDEKTTLKKKDSVLWPSKERTEPPQRVRTRLDEILESMNSPRLHERPPTGEMKDRAQSKEEQQQGKTSGGKEPLLEDDVTFGSYQPTLMSTPEGRQSRRQSVRFSTEDVSLSSPEKKTKFTTSTSSRHRNSADWLGLKTDDDDDRSFEQGTAKENKTTVESTKTPSSPSTERRPSVSGDSPAISTAKTATDTQVLADDVQKQTKPEDFKVQRRGQEEEEEDDWLAGALSRKKALTGSQPEVKTTKQDNALNLEEEGTGRGRENAVSSSKETSNRAPVREKRTKQDVPPQAASIATHPDPQPQPQHHLLPSTRGSAVPQMPIQALHETPQQAPTAMSAILADGLQQLLLQQQSQLLGLGGVMDSTALQKGREREKQSVDCQALQARIIQLEGQVKMLQLERDQSQFVLENIQQRHKQEIELMDSTHKAQVRRLEDLAAQTETRALQDHDDLMERLAAVTKSAEKECSELQAQYQRKMTQVQQERDHEVARLKDLQRRSILEMKKDHEDQIKRLKKLKDEEIDAVTSATSQTRSLTVVIEQMEQFSSRLGDLSSRVESTHEHTAQCLEQGARHRDEQLRMVQDRLAQKQKSMEEERAYLKEIIARMDTQLNEQQRQLEKERWKMTAEQAKAESTQRSLEEERRTLSMQINMEREELERAKSALLEEQKSVMQQCAEERKKLAAEWAHFHNVEKQRHERAEREASSLLEKREGSIISLAQEQADLKLHTAELKQKEMVLAQERESLERLREELEREKEKVSSTALRLKTRAQEVEAFSKLAADKHEEGERAVREAKCVEAEHEARLRNIQTQTERLRQQEQRLLQERMRSSHLQKDSEISARFSPQLIQPILPDATTFLPNPDLTSTMNIPAPASFAESQASALQASLALWRYSAEKDREYLEEEQIFLDNLKKRSYKSYFNTD
ncbi:fas-binding factor 1 homolog isoform X3 [Xyrichtys novacula]|uniref:Fas-binding factor 1 homolog isoform X3 n=1 Tax=Xyrichtys novacula TaxID=13765 RepID=A0AAV1GQH7_XYRNO|nr:fas-binding factor 1 homolog isoform X3 [Xyrichtys novacula]